MKKFKIIGLLLTTIITVSSCKKEVAVNWAEELKGTVWSGEFKNTTGFYQGVQYFSIVLNDYGKLTWHDIKGSQTNLNWTTSSGKIIITFANRNALGGTISSERITNFTEIEGTNAFQIISLNRSTVAIAESLTNTNWQGTITGYNNLLIECKNYPVLFCTVKGSGSFNLLRSGS